MQKDVLHSFGADFLHKVAHCYVKVIFG